MAWMDGARVGARLAAAAALAAGLSGCETARGAYDKAVGLLGVPQSNVDALAGQSPEAIYALGDSQLKAGDERAAAKTFDDLERLHPYSPLAKKAMVMSAYASFEGADYEKAITGAQRFIDFYPGDPEAAYARYIIAQSYYERMVDVGRDQDMTRQAMSALQDVIKRHPDSVYAREAKLQLDLTRDHLAGKDMDVGRFYLKRGDYVAAINRFRSVVEDYQGTTQVPEALHRLVEAYLSLGVEDEARAAAAVLGHNYQGSEWYQRSYALLQTRGLTPADKPEGWLSRVYRQVVKGDAL